MIQLDPGVTANSKRYMDKEDAFGAHNYHPLPVVLSKGEGIFLFDVDGKKYFDFLSAYSAVNQGHCHPKIIAAMTEQAKTLTLTSRAFYNNLLGECEEYMAGIFGYDKVLLMNSGAEAVESAMKLARKWAYKVKGINKDEAVIVFARNNFHGRTISVISASNDPSSTEGFGPLMRGIDWVEYNNTADLEQKLSANPNICAFIVEPVQGEAGVIVPDEKYLATVSQICKKYNVLYIADEIQTGMGRTGSLLASDYKDPHQEGEKLYKPDVLILGKALSGGTMPVSAVLANDEVMLTIQPGEHGSTFGGNPLACAVAKKSIEVLLDEKMVENADKMGVLFREGLEKIASKNNLITQVRGRGLLNAIEINSSESSELGWQICESLRDHGLLAKPTHGNKIRLAPPLIINETQIKEALQIIEVVIEKFA